MLLVLLIALVLPISMLESSCISDVPSVVVPDNNMVGGKWQ
jgi:hypothetical protein